MGTGKHASDFSDDVELVTADLKQNNWGISDLCISNWPTTSTAFFNIMKTVGQALNVSFSVHDLPGLLNRIQFNDEDETEDFFENFPCLSACGTFGEYKRGDFMSNHYIYKYWKENKLESCRTNCDNITKHIIAYRRDDQRIKQGINDYFR